MIEPLESGAEFEDVEALVRAAGNYVRPSEELRPRVLESARMEASERKALRRIWQAALALMLFASFSTTISGPWTGGSSFSADLLQVQAEVRAAGTDAAGWSLVDSFTDLRRRQAALLRLTQ